YDRNGVLLAENLPAYNLELTPERVKNIDAIVASMFLTRSGVNSSVQPGINTRAR
ncbi:hypothetical protein, partial [Kaarinaea lacus]